MKNILMHIVIISLAALLWLVNISKRSNAYLDFLNINHLMEQLINRSWDMELRFNGFQFDILREGGVVISGVGLYIPETLYLYAPRAVLIPSLSRLFKSGDWPFSIHLVEPEINIVGSALAKNDSAHKYNVPAITFNDGRVTFIQDEKVIRCTGGVNGLLKMDKTDRFCITGIVEFENAQVLYANEKMVFNGSIEIDEGSIGINNVSISIGDMKTGIQGILNFSQGRRFAGSLVMDRLKIISGKGNDTQFMQYLRGVDISADCTLTNPVLFGVTVKKITAKAVSHQGALLIRDIHAHDDSITANGQMSIHPGEGAGFDIAFQLKDIDILPVLQARSSAQPWMIGTINLRGRLWGSTESINGDVIFSSFDGRLQRLKLLSQVTGLLNLKQISFIGDRGVRNGFAYNYITARFKIRDNLVSFDNLHLNSDTLQLSATGTYNLQTNLIDSVLGIHPLETYDRAINYLPIIGWILSGKEKSFLVFHLKVRGAGENVRVYPIPVRSISRRVAGALIRTLLLPYTFVTDPKKLFPSFEKEDRKN